MFLILWDYEFKQRSCWFSSLRQVGFERTRTDGIKALALLLCFLLIQFLIIIFLGPCSSTCECFWTGGKKWLDPPKNASKGSLFCHTRSLWNWLNVKNKKNKYPLFLNIAVFSRCRDCECFWNRPMHILRTGIWTPHSFSSLSFRYSWRNSSISST